MNSHPTTIWSKWKSFLGMLSPNLATDFRFWGLGHSLLEPIKILAGFWNTASFWSKLSNPFPRMAPLSQTIGNAWILESFEKRMDNDFATEIVWKQSISKPWSLWSIMSDIEKAMILMELTAPWEENWEKAESLWQHCCPMPDPGLELLVICSGCWLKQFFLDCLHSNY